MQPLDYGHIDVNPPRSSSLSWRSAACKRADQYNERGGLNHCSELANNFIAIGISGGGVKASIFGAEALFYLDAFGLLPQASMISSVSGGSFAAAYYALSCEYGNSECQPVGDRPRPVWHYQETMEIMGIGFESVVTKGILDYLNPFPYSPVTPEHFGKYLDKHYFGDNSDVSSPQFHLSDLNPKRPKLVLNNAILSASKLLMEPDGKAEGFLRRRTADELMHFAFTDYYFNQIGANLAAVPLGYAAAASGAFPLLIDYANVPNYKFCERQGIDDKKICLDDDHKPYRLLLSDGGSNDNQGMIEIFETVGEMAFGESRSDLSKWVCPEDSPPRKWNDSCRTVQPEVDKIDLDGGDNVLGILINSSVTESNGVIDSPDTYLTGLQRLIGGINRAEAAIDAYSGSELNSRRRLYLDDIELILQKRKFENIGAREIIGVREIGLITLNRYGEGGADIARRQDAKVELKTADEKKEDEAYNKIILERQQKVWDALSKPERRKQLSLGKLHPQCLLEQAKIIDSTLANMESGNQYCLREAARWSSALIIEELCNSFEKKPLFSVNTIDYGKTPEICRQWKENGLSDVWRKQFDKAETCSLDQNSTHNSDKYDQSVIRNLVFNPGFYQEMIYNRFDKDKKPKIGHGLDAIKIIEDQQIGLNEICNMDLKTQTFSSQ